MHNVISKIIIGFALAFTISRLFAQTPQVYSLEQCLTLAKQNSLRLRLAENELLKARLARSEIRTAGLPGVKAKAGSGYAPDARDFGYDPAITDGGQLNAQIELEQSVYDGRVRRLKTSELTVDLKRWAIERQIAERDLVAEIKQRFIELLRAQRQIELQQESVEQLTAYADLTENLYHGGAVGYTDVLKSQVQLSNAVVSLQKAREAAAIAASSLAEQMGIRPETMITVAGSLDTFAVQYGDLLLHETDSTLASNPELRAARLDIEKSKLEIQATRGERKPTFDFVADAGWLTSRNNLIAPAGERYSGLGFSAGFAATLPLFNWGATGLHIQQKRLETESLQMQSQLLERSLQGQVNRLRRQLKSGFETLSTLRSNMHTVEQNYLLTKSTYAGGGSSATEVLAAQQLLVEAKLAELETLANLSLLSVQLEQITIPYVETKP
jgi:outer membrane protein